MNLVPAIVQNLRSRWFGVCVHVGLWLLLYLALTNLRGKAPDLHEDNGPSLPVQSPVPVARLDPLFSPGIWPKSLVTSNLLNTFYTRHFIPPQTPVAPPPTTKKIELTYQGFYETEGAPKHVMVKMGDLYLVAAMGAKITANLFAVDANMQALTLTNSAGLTNILSLNTKKELEVPIQ